MLLVVMEASKIGLLGFVILVVGLVAVLVAPTTTGGGFYVGIAISFIGLILMIIGIFWKISIAIDNKIGGVNED